MISVDDASSSDVSAGLASGSTSTAGVTSISVVSSAVVSSTGTVAVSEAVVSVVVALAADEEDDDDDDDRLLDSFTLAASSSGSTLGVGVLDDFRSDTVIPRTGTFRTASISLTNQLIHDNIPLSWAIVLCGDTRYLRLS